MRRSEGDHDHIRGEIERLFYGHGLRRAIRCADAIAAISGATAAEIARFHPPAAGRTTVTLSGVSPHFRPSPSSAAELAALGIDPTKPFVLTVGQDAPYKNHEGVLRGFAAAFADAPIDLVLVQRSGSGRGRLDKLARLLRISDRVRFLTTVDSKQLVALYSAAQVLLHPSFAEGFGNPVLEAMACGCPVVTSAVSSMPEVAGGAALLVDPYDVMSIASGLVAVVRSPGRAAAMRQAGLARAASLRWRSFAAANLAIYRHVLSDRSTRPI